MLVRTGLPWITPAYAGKRRSATPAISAAWDHPRLRGEKTDQDQKHQHKEGSPPLTRGKVFDLIKNTIEFRITSAYAGKSFDSASEAENKGDHPRLRGEKPLWLKKSRRNRGSPPLTRGKAFRIRRFSKYARITPAYAGKSSF